MKIKVTQRRNSCWYNKFIGSEFEVTNDHKGYYTVKHNGTDDICVVNHDDCEVVPEFSIGSRVRILEPGEYHGKLGNITERRTGSYVMYPWNVKFDDGNCEIYDDSEIELVVEETQWLTKEAALILAIKGAKVVMEGSSSPNTHVFFDGKEFKYYNGCSRNIERINISMDCRWKLWTPPTPPKPKFSIDSFVVYEESYVRIIDTEYSYGVQRYYVSKGTFANTKADCMLADESELSMA